MGQILCVNMVPFQKSSHNYVLSMKLKVNMKVKLKVKVTTKLLYHLIVPPSGCVIVYTYDVMVCST